MNRVIVESPFAGDRERNAKYLRACLADCLKRGEAPFASHGLYPGTLDDDVPDQRRLGIQAGFAWRVVAHKTVVYQDLGVTMGMQEGIQHASAMGHPIEYRNLNGEWARVL